MQVLGLVVTRRSELTSTENKIGFARQAFNDAATNYNIPLTQLS